jgi:hypothetical protein
MLINVDPDYFLALFVFLRRSGLLAQVVRISAPTPDLDSQYFDLFLRIALLRTCLFVYKVNSFSYWDFICFSPLIVVITVFMLQEAGLPAGS